MVAFAISSGTLISHSTYPTIRKGGGCPVVSSGRTMNQERALAADRMREYLPLVVIGRSQRPQTMRKPATTAAIMTGGTLRIDGPRIKPPGAGARYCLQGTMAVLAFRRSLMNLSASASISSPFTTQAFSVTISPVAFSLPGSRKIFQGDPQRRVSPVS